MIFCNLIFKKVLNSFFVLNNPMRLMKLSIKSVNFIIFSLIILSSIFLSACEINNSITGNIVHDFSDSSLKCYDSEYVSKIIKGNELGMCCIEYFDENSKYEICESLDSLFSEITIYDYDEIVQRKVIYPFDNSSCVDVYGKINEENNLVLIENLSYCK